MRRGNGLAGKSTYRGAAPGATIVLARITGAGTTSIDTDDVLLGVGFLFDRASALGMPIVVNLSLGSDFGPHDGTMAWEQTLASFVGPDHPGRALVAAAGNSGSISPADGGLVHQNVHVSTGATMRVPIPTVATQDGGVEVWVAMHAGASIRVGLDGPDGTWIEPVASASSAGKDSGTYQAAVYNGSEPTNRPVPAQSHGAVVAWQGAWPGGTYAVTLSGSGTADLYVEATGSASAPTATGSASPRACARAPSTFRPRCPRSSASAAPSTRRRGPISTATSSTSTSLCSIRWAVFRTPTSSPATQSTASPAGSRAPGPR